MVDFFYWDGSDGFRDAVMQSGMSWNGSPGDLPDRYGENPWNFIWRRQYTDMHFFHSGFFCDKQKGHHGFDVGKSIYLFFGDRSGS